MMDTKREAVEETDRKGGKKWWLLGRGGGVCQGK